jgi:hypothetical protein
MATSLPTHVYILNGGEKAFLDPYRVFRMIQETYRAQPAVNIILHDFIEMMDAFEKGEEIEMIKGMVLRRVALSV